MKILCIDVGNTSIHYGIVEGQTAFESGSFQTSNLRSGPSKKFSKALAPLLDKVGGVSFCSVVPEINDTLLASINVSKHPVFQLTHLNCNGLHLEYPKP